MSSALPRDGTPDELPRSESSAADEAAFDTLVRTHYGRLCNFAIRFVESRDVAEDVVQDVFVRIWQRRTEFRHGDPLPYLYQAVRNRAANHVRDQQVRQRWRTHAEEEAAMAERSGIPAGAAMEPAAADEVAAAIANAIAALPERCRLIFTMSREQDLTYAEIARILGLSVKTVETQMGRALKALRLRLAEYLSLAIMIGGTGRWLG